MVGFPLLVPFRRGVFRRATLLLGIALSILCFGMGCGDFTLFGDDDESSSQGPCDGDPCASIDNAQSGSCTADGTDDFTCDCDSGFVWDGATNTCEANPCDPDPCEDIANANAGTCTAEGSDFTCTCQTNYFWKDDGNECVDPCASEPCDSIENAVVGSCTGVDAENFDCQCFEDYVWNGATDSCEADPCDPDPCDGLDNAVRDSCTPQGADDFTCDCNTNYFWEDVGNTCEDPCASNPCDTIPNAQAGSCTGLDAVDFTCDCDEGFTWNTQSNQCEGGGGTCDDLENCLLTCTSILDATCHNSCFLQWTGCDCVFDLNNPPVACIFICGSQCFDPFSQPCYLCGVACAFDELCQ